MMINLDEIICFSDCSLSIRRKQIFNIIRFSSDVCGCSGSLIITQLTGSLIVESRQNFIWQEI